VLPEGVRPVFRVQSNLSPRALDHTPQRPDSKLHVPWAGTGGTGGAGVGEGVGRGVGDGVGGGAGVGACVSKPV